MIRVKAREHRHSCFQEVSEKFPSTQADKKNNPITERTREQHGCQTINNAQTTFSHEAHEHGAGGGGGQDVHLLLRCRNLFSPLSSRGKPGLHRSQLSEAGQHTVNLLRCLKQISECGTHKGRARGGRGGEAGLFLFSLRQLTNNHAFLSTPSTAVPLQLLQPTFEGSLAFLPYMATRGGGEVWCPQGGSSKSSSQ